MRVHDMRIRRDSGIMNVVAVLKGMGVPFVEVVDKIAGQFNLSPERAQAEVKEYWNK
jgi:hypothetical protein